MITLARLGLRNVGRNRKRSAATLLAASLGTLGLIAMASVTNGFLQFLHESVILSKVGALQVHRAGYLKSVEAGPIARNLPDSPEFVARLKEVPGITGVTRRIQFLGLVSNGRSQTTFAGRGIDVATEREACPHSGRDLFAGGPLGPEDHSEAVLGADLARSLEVSPPGASGGHFVTLSSTSPDGRANSLDVRVKATSFSGMALENKRSLIVPLSLAQELLGMQGKVTEYALGVSHFEEIPRIRADLLRVLGPGYEVHTWQDLQPFWRDSIAYMQLGVALAALILAIVVMTGVVNTMLMTTFERTREIGTLMAMGMRRRQIVLLFVTEAAVLGGLGGLVGATAGKGLVAIVARIGIPMTMLDGTGNAAVRPVLGWPFALLTVAGAIACALLAALIPATRASKLDPASALRST